MKLRRFNYQLWAGFLLSLLAPMSYAFVFVRWPVTRDVPWVPLLLLAIAAVLLFFGMRRAFASDRRLSSKIVSSIAATLSILFIGIFLFSIFVFSKWLPASQGAPHVGQKAPTFDLADTTGKSVSLATLLTEPINGKAPKGVLLIYYRGYW